MQLLEAVTANQYQRRIAQIQRDVLRLENGAVRDLNTFLDQLRRETIADLALVPQTNGWPAYRLNALLTEIDQAKVALQQRLGVVIRDTSRQAWQMGSTAQTDALRVQSYDPTALSLDQLMIAQQMQTDLVARVSQDFRTRAAREITLTVAGAQTPQQAMTKIGILLQTQTRRQKMGPIAAQAERLVRTETMGVFSTADRIADDRLGQDVPGLRKWWDAADGPRTRPTHRAAENRYRPGGTEGPIPLDADFIVGGEKAQGPMDVRLSAGERVNCRCVRVLWSPQWGSG